MFNSNQSIFLISNFWLIFASCELLSTSIWIMSISFLSYLLCFTSDHHWSRRIAVFYDWHLPFVVSKPAPYASVIKFQESYAAIEKAIRSLASFYSKAGPFATMTEEVKASILNDLKTAEDCL